MRIDFPYPGYESIEPFDIPDERFMGMYAPATMPEINEEERLIEGMAHPFGAPQLRHKVRPGDRVLILFDDGTRITPVHRLLPHVARELSAAGVPDERVKLLSAPGTHRKMSNEELRHKLGPLRDRFEVHQHDWLDESRLHDFGRTHDGTRVTANKLLAESDFILGLGAIVPHRVKGLSGGAKIAFPGVSGREMMYRNQWEASMQMSETVMGVAENSMRLRMEEAARMVGLQYIVNLVLDRDRRIAGCFAGDPVVAHREGGRLARRIYGVRLPARADVVVIDAHPADRDFWQSAKGAYAGTMAVRDGGVLILVAPNPEGVAGNHPNLLEIGYRPHAEIVAMVQSGQIEDLAGAAILADIAQIVDRAECIMVSPGIQREKCERLGFRYAASCEDALRMASERLGDDAQVAVLRHGGHLLPLADERALAACLADTVEHT